jgi:hypothetical protein
VSLHRWEGAFNVRHAIGLECEFDPVEQRHERRFSVEQRLVHPVEQSVSFTDSGP